MISLNNFGNIPYEIEIQKRDYIIKIVDKTTVLNDIYISKFIKQIPYYKNNFAPIEDYCKISIQKAKGAKVANKSVILKRSLEPRKKKYLTIKILEKTNFAFSNKPLLFFEGFQHVLSTIVKLLNKNIVHLNITTNNLMFDPALNIPLVTNFEKSIHICDINYDPDSNKSHTVVDKWTQICKRIFCEEPKRIYPFELHIINLIIQNDEITSSDIDTLIKEYIENNIYLRAFNNEYREKYIKQCYKIISHYELNLNLIETLSFHYKSWDNFLLCGLYIDFFYDLQKKLKEHHQDIGGICRLGEILSEFLDMLGKNISPDFTERLTVLETYHETTRIIFNNTSRENYEKMKNIWNVWT